MKHILFLIAFLSIACKDDDRINNPFLPDVALNLEINLNLPQFRNLEFSGNVAVIDTDGVGIKGVIIYNIDGNQFNAFELSDPNRVPGASTALVVEGSIASCSCEEGNKYDLLTGLPIAGGGGFALKRYNAQRQGDILIITN